MIQSHLSTIMFFIKIEKKIDCTKYRVKVEVYRGVLGKESIIYYFFKDLNNILGQIPPLFGWLL